jgi:hypothetical protein
MSLNMNLQKWPTPTYERGPRGPAADSFSSSQ